MLDRAYRLHEYRAGDQFEIGPFRAGTWALPHFVPNAGIRLAAAGRVLAYTGDTGPSPNLVELARDADLLLAEASFVDAVPEPSRDYLSSARQAGLCAAHAGAGRLILTHLFPGTDPATARAAAADGYGGELAVAEPGVVVELR
jgi:ribonuclease BN (tRNA processing enzyme)